MHDGSAQIAAHKVDLLNFEADVRFGTGQNASPATYTILRMQDIAVEPAFRSSESECVTETRDRHTGYSVAYVICVLRSSVIEIDPDGEDFKGK